MPRFNICLNIKLHKPDVDETRLGGKRGAGVPGCGVRGPGVWKTRGLVENAGSGGKRGVWWKMRALVENAGSNVENTGNHYSSPNH